MLTGILVGLAIVFETLYWLKVFGKTESAGSLLVLVLVREIAPLVVAAIVIGRSISVFLLELGNMQADGQVRMLDAQGIDPFIYLVVPRVMAVTVCMFCLTIVFTVVTLGAGFYCRQCLERHQSNGLRLYFRDFSGHGTFRFRDHTVDDPFDRLCDGPDGLLWPGYHFTGSAADVPGLLPTGIMKSAGNPSDIWCAVAADLA